MVRWRADGDGGYEEQSNGILTSGSLNPVGEKETDSSYPLYLVREEEIKEDRQRMEAGRGRGRTVVVLIVTVPATADGNLMKRG